VQRDTVIPNAPGTQGYNGYAYTANNPATFTDPSGHSLMGVTWTASLSAGALVLTSLVASFVYSGPVLGAVAAAPVLWFLVLVVFFALALMAIELASGCGAGLMTLQCDGSMAALGHAELREWIWQPWWSVAGTTSTEGTEQLEDLWNRPTVEDKDRNTRPRPTPSPEPVPTPDRPRPPLPVPTPDRKEERCREAGKNWWGDMAYGHIVANHGPDSKVPRKSKFYRSYIDRATLTDLIFEVFAAPSFVAAQSTDRGGDCYFEGPLGYPAHVGRGENGLPTSVTAVSLDTADNFVVTAYPK
jgi:hypothetical protein